MGGEGTDLHEGSVTAAWEVAIRANQRVFQIDDPAMWWTRRVLPLPRQLGQRIG
jgi:hypothetical protein